MANTKSILCVSPEGERKKEQLLDRYGPFCFILFIDKAIATEWMTNIEEFDGKHLKTIYYATGRLS